GYSAATDINSVAATEVFKAQSGNTLNLTAPKTMIGLLLANNNLSITTGTGGAAFPLIIGPAGAVLTNGTGASIATTLVFGTSEGIVNTNTGADLTLSNPI